MTKINGLVLSTITAAFLVGCGGGGGSSSSSGTTTTTTSGSSTSTTSTDTSTGTTTTTTTDVTVERGPVYGATVTDANGQVATQKSGTNVYVFATTPVYPITASGGIVDIDRNGVDAGDIELTTPLTSYSKVITPITDYLGDTSTSVGKAKLAKLKEITGVTNESDLITKVASESSTEVLILTNAIYDIMNDGDSTNDDFITDYDNSELKTTYTELKTEADKYTNKKEIIKALEEKVVTNLGLTTITSDEATNSLNGTNKATTLKVADLKKWVEYDPEDEWYGDAIVADGKLTFNDYNYEWNLSTQKYEWVTEQSVGNLTITADATTPYKFNYVDSASKEEGVFTILSTKKVTKYTDLYASQTTHKVTKKGTELVWDIWSNWTPTYWDSTTQKQVAITDIAGLIKNFTNGGWTEMANIKVFLNADGTIVKGTKDSYGNYTKTTTKVGTWKQEGDYVVGIVGKETRYFKVGSENGAYYIAGATISDIGYSENAEIFTGTSIDDLINNIKAPAPVFTSWGNTYADENQTSAYTPTVTDRLKVTYSLSGLESNYFNIDSATGVVTFKVAPDYETKLAYSFYIIATNSAGKSSSQLVNIKINNLEESTTPTIPVTTTSFVSGDTFKGLVYNIITSPITGKQWLDRNLGATQVCTSSTDTACYGDYYQWGRLADGHEKANSATTTTQASTISSAGNQFVIQKYDWTTADANGSQRSAQWSKTDGTGVCPVGFRVPTSSELSAENITNGTDAFTKLKFPLAGARYFATGIVDGKGTWGDVWTSSSSTSANKSYYKYFENDSDTDVEYRTDGRSVRCIKGN